MTLQRSLSIPLFFAIARSCLLRVREHLHENNLVFHRPVILSGPTRTHAIAAECMASLGLAPDALQVVASNNAAEVRRLGALVSQQHRDVIIAVGGGKVLDVGKMASYQQGLPFIAVPTTLSSDGIASPIAVIRGDAGYHESLGARIPIAVLVDLDVVRDAPADTLRAGVGDLISNLSAIEDWELAIRTRGERIDSFAMLVARNAAETFLDRVREHPHETVSLYADPILARLAEGLLMSGLAMAIAGTSRPCSGAEHLISHALDRILTKPFAHGLQVGMATVFVQRLRGSDVSSIVEAFTKLGIPTNPDALGVPRDVFLEAVRRAPSMRPGRTTVLDTLNPHVCADVLEELCAKRVRSPAEAVPIPGRDQETNPQTG